ncbi:MAG: YtxH domain-containing protein [Anaerolineae bacterium]
MKEIMYFLLGAVVGATLALLFAPESGKDLRANIQATAEKDAAKLQAEWQAAMARTNERLEQMQADLKQALQRASEQEEGAA